MSWKSAQIHSNIFVTYVDDAVTAVATAAAVGVTATSATVATAVTASST